jgi:hypothetical protein
VYVINIKNNVAFKEIVGFKWWYLIFNVIIFSGAVLIHRPYLNALAGLLVGSAFSIINFYLLGLTIEKSLERGSTRSGINTSVSYLLRNISMGVVLYALSRISMDAFVCSIFPLFFPRIILTIKYKKGAESNWKERR